MKDAEQKSRLHAGSRRGASRLANPCACFVAVPFATLGVRSFHHFRLNGDGLSGNIECFVLLAVVL